MAGGVNLDDDEGITGINVTPLVDIMLVLLIIFMVASSYIVENSIEVELPSAASGGETLETTLSFKLLKTGEIFLNGKRATKRAIIEKVKAVAKADPKAQAIIAADKGAEHGEVMKLIDLVRMNGILKFAISVDPEEDG